LRSKPDKRSLPVGFDSNGMLKLFDFGLAKSLDAVEREAEHGNFYLLTGNTGSLRYMAPEVARDEPYNLTADCYSFGILFWQICSLTTPYAGLTQQTHSLNVVQRGMRPKPDKSWPHSWSSLMTSAWNADPPQRPSMSEIEHQLCAIIDEITEEDGVVPSRASDIRAKKKRKKVSRENHVLDVDTRITETAEFNDEKLQPRYRNSEII
jgi:serine/threonine protein kinase